GARMAWRHPLLMRAMAGAHEDGPRPGTAAGDHVESAVADHHGPLRVERELSTRLLDHARRGLAPAALLSKLRDDGIRMVRAMVIAVDSGAAACEARVDRGVNVLKKSLVDDPAADTALVGDDDGRVACPIQQSDSIRAEGIELEQINPIEVAAFF